MDIFLSYCRRDTEFVLKLKNDVEKLGYTTWMDNQQIAGGDQWESEIEESIEKSKIFLVVVSRESNASNWVRRETIRAEHLKKTRIPILLNDELPLRLLDLQYVDFRGPYEGGFSTLCPLMEKHLGKRAARNEALAENECKYVFVYGSLRPDDDSGMIWTQNSVAGMLGQLARLPRAKLYIQDFATVSFDGATEEHSVVGWVLTAGEAVFKKKLAEYDLIQGYDPHGSGYSNRTQRDVWLLGDTNIAPAGTCVKAYVYHRSVMLDEKYWIPSGDWLRRDEHIKE